MKDSAGYTLVEVAVAMLIMAMVSTGIFAIVLTAKTNEVRSDRRQLAVAYAQKLNDTLQGYVGVDVDASTYFCAQCTAANGPCTSNGASLGCPKFTGDSCGANAFSAGCWHNADILLPGWFRAQPFLGHMCYSVSQNAFSNSIPQGSSNLAMSFNNVQSKVTWATATDSAGNGIEVPCP